MLDTALAGGYTIYGRAQAISSIRSSVEAAKAVHQVHSPEIKFHGDSADVIWAMQDRVVWSAEQAQHKGNTGYGHYHEHFVRCVNGRALDHFEMFLQA